MKKSICIIISFFVYGYAITAKDFVLRSSSPTQMRMLVACVKSDDMSLVKKCARTLQRDVSFSGQLAVDVMVTGNDCLSNGEIKKLSSTGKEYQVYATLSFDNQTFLVRMYDAINGMELLHKNYTYDGESIVTFTHAISDDAWQLLTSKPGFFTTKIAYSCLGGAIDGRSTKHIYVSDYNGENARCVVPKDSVCIAPRWHASKQTPLLFYSDCGVSECDRNIRLMSVNSNNVVAMASNFGGMNMLPAFFPDGDAMIYCLSGAQGQCQLYLYKKNTLKRLNLGGGNCFSPTVGCDGKTLYYCWDGRAGYPEIYSYDLKRRKKRRISQGGYCVTPSYCQESGKLAYAKGVKGTLQLFVYDERTKKHTQLTFGTGDKQEPSWSPCGNFLIFSFRKDDKSRIALFNLITNKKHFVTPESKRCEYPSWSPRYDNPYIFA